MKKTSPSIGKMLNEIAILFKTKQKITSERAKKVVSDSPWLMDFTIWLVNSVVNLPTRQVKSLSNSNHKRTVIKPAHHRAS